MVRKTALIFMVVLALLISACTAPVTTVNSNGAGTNTNSGLGNTNSSRGNTNGNTNTDLGSNTNTGLGNANGNTNTSLGNTNGNANTGLGNANGNTNSGLGNTNANTNTSLGNANGNTNSGLSNTNANTNTSLGNTNTGVGNTNANTNTGVGANTNGNTNTSGTTLATPAGTGLTGEVDTYETWVSAVQRVEGEQVVPEGAVTTMGFNGLPSGQARAVTVRNEQLQVIEFADRASRKQVSDALASGQMQLDQAFPGLGVPTHAWAAGRVIIVYFGNQDQLISDMTRIMGQPILGAGKGNGNNGNGLGVGSIPPGLRSSIEQWLNGQMALNGAQIQLVSAQQTTFNDTCLGLGNPGEFCNVAQTPGWIVVFSVNGKQYTAHASQDGSIMRLQQP